MARLFFSARIPVTPAANPRTVFQLMAPANQRVLLHHIEVIMQGVAAAVAPIEFDLQEQADAGTSSNGAALLQKLPPYAAETIQSGLLYNFSGAEPAAESGHLGCNSFGIHPQAVRREIIFAPREPLIMVGGSRWALRYKSATGVALIAVPFFEE